MLPGAHQEAFRQSLIRGQYNLLLGSGVSIGAKNEAGELLRSAEKLRLDLCKLRNVPESTALNRVTKGLTPEQTKHQLTEHYKVATFSRSHELLPRFLWQNIFTFNIDNGIEQAYGRSDRRLQSIQSLNYSDVFSVARSPTQLPTVHLHGFVNKPNDRYVFSLNDYASLSATDNPWMIWLADILPVEPFIVAGTSLSEPDVEYYLKRRNRQTARADRGPAIWVEPYPDAILREDCDRHDMLLIEATFDEFLSWADRQFPNRPDALSSIDSQILMQLTDSLARDQIGVFQTQFELVKPIKDPVTSTIPSKFFFGAQPTWNDLALSLDVPRRSVVKTLAKASAFGKRVKTGHTTILLDHAGTGKSTIARRLAYDLSEVGELVLSCTAISRIDVKTLIEVLRQLDRPTTLVIDGIADHADSVAEIQVEVESLKHRVTIVGVERAYRKPQLDIHLSPSTSQYDEVGQLGFNEATQLIEKYRQAGLVGRPEVLQSQQKVRHFARALAKEPIAVAACRILHRFEALDQIATSLWNDAIAAERRIYLMSALAAYCYRVGVKYSILQAADPSADVRRQFSESHPLPLRYNSIDQNYVAPLNSVIGTTFVERASRLSALALYETFQRLTDALGSYVNREAIRQGTPEARLAARILDWDTIVKPLLGNDGRKLYEHAQRKWEWNSRFWEQKALMVEDLDIGIALQYARQAVSLEKHQFPLTTLGKILFRAMDNSPYRKDEYFNEAWNTLNQAINLELSRYRATIHPYMTLVTGVTRYAALGGRLSPHQSQTLRTFVNDAAYRFRRDAQMKAAIERMDAVIK